MGSVRDSLSTEGWGRAFRLAWGSGAGWGAGVVAEKAGGEAGAGGQGDHADDQGEAEGQGHAGPAAEAVGRAGHDRAGDAGADGLAEDVEQLQARGGPALLARGRPGQGGPLERGGSLAG